MSRIAGGWEGRDTAAYLGKEGRRTSGERKFVELYSGTLSALASMRYRSGHVSPYRSTRGPLWCRASARRPKSAKPAKRAGRARNDVAQERLGWRGQKGRPSTDLMTQDNRLQTPSPLDPGHTA